jgi:hypothetical protein
MFGCITIFGLLTPRKKLVIYSSREVNSGLKHTHHSEATCGTEHKNFPEPIDKAFRYEFPVLLIYPKYWLTTTSHSYKMKSQE